MPEKKETVTVTDTANCFSLAWSILIATPMWYVILFYLIQRSEAPTWVWALYWVYVPAGVFGRILTVFTMEFFKNK